MKSKMQQHITQSAMEAGSIGFKVKLLILLEWMTKVQLILPTIGVSEDE
jgi:hypothetical protein